MSEFYIGLHPKCGKVHGSVLIESSIGMNKRQREREEKAIQEYVGKMVTQGLDVKKITQEEYKGYDFCLDGGPCKD